MNWNDLYKIRLNDYSDSFLKHEVVKLIIVKNLLNKYNKSKKYQEIYTEFPISQGKICDVYHLNHKTKETYCYEIQKNISKKWIQETKKLYEKYDKETDYFDWIIIDLNILSDNIIELNKQIKELII